MSPMKTELCTAGNNYTIKITIDLDPVKMKDAYFAPLIGLTLVSTLIETYRPKET